MSLISGQTVQFTIDILNIVCCYQATFFGGLSPEVRRESWKFLLHYFPFGSTIQQREQLRNEKEKEYLDIDYSRYNPVKMKYVDLLDLLVVLKWNYAIIHVYDYRSFYTPYNLI